MISKDNHHGASTEAALSWEWKMSNLNWGMFITIPFVIAVMGVSGTILYDTLRGVNLKQKPVSYVPILMMTMFSLGLLIMVIFQALMVSMVVPQ